jgi:hypothetical protein
MRRQSAKGPNDPSYLHRLTDDLYIDAEFSGNAIRFANHVCVQPSCQYQMRWVDGRPRISVVTTRDVRVGEEFTCSYGFEDCEDAHCECGCPYCQGYMGDAIVKAPGHAGKRIPKQSVRIPVALAREATEMPKLIRAAQKTSQALSAARMLAEQPDSATDAIEAEALAESVTVGATAGDPLFTQRVLEQQQRISAVETMECSGQCAHKHHHRDSQLSQKETCPQEISTAIPDESVNLTRATSEDSSTETVTKRTRVS